MIRVFISYRRDDSAGYAGRLLDRLAGEFGKDSLFMDVSAIPLGMNFVKVLREEVSKCHVLLAVIGPKWLAIADLQGRRRLDNENDFVRVEIGAALARDIPVIPILLDSASIPSADQLPPELLELPQRHGLHLRHDAFEADISRLIQGLRDIEQDLEYEQLPENERKQVEIHQWVDAFRGRQNRNPRIPELRRAFPLVPKTTAWRYCTGRNRRPDLNS